MKIKYINVIETSSLCNKTCPYCPHGGYMKRKTGLMDMRTFKRAIQWVKYLHKFLPFEGDIPVTVRDLNLHGMGEALLNPLIFEMVSYATQELPNVYCRMTTNGSLVTSDIIKKLRDSGLYRLDITDHVALDTVNAMDLRDKAGIDGAISRDFVHSAHNWAGQIKWPQQDYHPQCLNLTYATGVVTWDGLVTTCCLDAGNNSVLGSIWDHNLPEFDFQPFSLCKNCHHEKPDWVKNIEE